MALALLLACTVALALETDPIPGVDVKVGKVPPGGGIIIAEGTTDKNGIFATKDLPEGTYLVRFAAAGHTFEISGNEAGDKIRILDGAHRGARTSRSVAKPVVYTRNFDGIIANVEVLGDSLKITIAKQKNAAQTQRR
jgi:hypothetical protein